MSNLLATAGSYGKRVLSAARDGFAQLQQRLGGVRSARPADDEAVDGDFSEVKDHLSERSITSQLLRISLVALLLKALHTVADRKWLLAVSSGISSLSTLPLAMWPILDVLMATVVPLLCGITMLLITWYTAFLDSCIPGVYPSPTESKKKKLSSWPTPFHIGHTIALANMLFLSVLIYFGVQNASEFQSS
ncbi:ADP-ribosylation factor-like protein 6-interacting protein 6 [Frankliniella fusca]|uniref:ADP-ribosylation factor-like protein 6-interacting protein 6 n=1 Tax=Frankliniella fusca TaxID=407009 RepID=A0AAE1H2Z5_9NEOP|nr:ADP-ribosylation factor-like protein 6-interacting protein 6 [Frankliniella fusca]